MSEEDQAPMKLAPAGQIRTLAVRLDDDLHAQLDILAQLNDRSITEEIRVALERWAAVSRSDPDVLSRARAARADIHREAQLKRRAIDAILSNTNSVGSPHRNE